MTNWIDLTNFAATFGGLVVALLGLFLSLYIPFMDRWSRRYFTVFFLLLTAYVSSSLLEQVSCSTLRPSSALLTQIAIFGESLFSSLLMPLLSLYLLRCVHEPWRNSALLRSSLVLLFVYLVLLLHTQFSGVFYTVTPENVYARGPWYPVLLIPPALLMLLNLIALFRRWALFSPRQRLAFSVYLTLPLVCMLIQMRSYGLLMIVIGTCVASLFLFVNILIDQFDRYMAQKEELAKQRASIMVLQMRPHFIYNTMMSIYYLCQQDPPKAQQVTLDFTSYLRKNFTALVREDTIPFSEELEHTRAYLAVEQVRFEGKLYVEWDTPYTSFRIPPLTLQPIVENAVKHGVSPDLSPLRLFISTRHTGAGVELRVEDTGPGFQPADDNQPHIALANIRERLSLMCGGSLLIGPRPDGGTVITLLIPEKGTSVP